MAPVMSETTHEPCGQHTIWEPQCQTCRRLATLEERAAELLEALADILKCAAFGAIPEHVWRRAIAVRAKAEGRSS